MYSAHLMWNFFHCNTDLSIEISILEYTRHCLCTNIAVKSLNSKFQCSDIGIYFPLWPTNNFVPSHSIPVPEYLLVHLRNFIKAHFINHIRYPPPPLLTFYPYLLPSITFSPLPPFRYRCRCRHILRSIAVLVHCLRLNFLP